MQKQLHIPTKIITFAVGKPFLTKIQNMSIMRKLLLFTSLLALVGSMGSCKKETNTDLLTDHPWVIKSMTISPAIEDPLTGSTITDFYNSLYYPTCAKDDFLTFLEDGTSLADAGTTLCGGEDQVTEGTWAFNSDETKITFDAGTEDELLYNIIELSGDTFKSSYTEVDATDGTTYTFTVTAKAK